MAREGHAPKVFLRVNRMGIPYVTVGYLVMWICLGYMSLSSSASTVFRWLQNMVAVTVLVNW
jgi:yeast amino acid transporter